MLDLSLCRSLLFVPANADRFVDKAHTRGADVVVLDLEDSIPIDQKTSARIAAQANAAMLCQRGSAVAVRINADSALVGPDIEAAVGAPVLALVLPKVESAEQVAAVADQVARAEVERESARTTVFIAQIESLQALSRADDIARAPRVAALSLGSEDFSASVGGAPTAEALLLPNQMVLFAARRAHITPLGFPGSIAAHGDLPAFRRSVRRGRELGFRGAFCIHPNQVGVLNEEFSPDGRELEEAHAIVAAFEAALREGRGSTQHKGRMIDPPVVTRARAVIAAAQHVRRG
ncbi:MAG: HpcH/HpaI aldolase/citrate lyase family protein [Steroidobacteraceae bacterium]